MSVELKAGDAAPDFDLPADGGGRVRLADHAGKPLVVYFYPKDDTTGCTNEAKGFSEAIGDFAKAGCAVIGVSKDSVKSHEKFKAKYALAFPLGSDADGVMVDAYGVWVEKSLYGRKYMGIDRSTFLIDAAGRIAKVWRKVKVPGHVAQVLAAAQALLSATT
jgi:peroxiredoxin Q/BCP